MNEVTISFKADVTQIARLSNEEMDVLFTEDTVDKLSKAVKVVLGADDVRIRDYKMLVREVRDESDS